MNLGYSNLTSLCNMTEKKIKPIVLDRTQQMNHQNKHKGRIAIVAGSGPSLRYVDPELVKDSIIIAVNGSILKFPDADYFFSCDARCTLHKSWFTVRESNCEIIVSSGGSPFGCYNEVAGRPWNEGIEDRVTIVDREKGPNHFMAHDCDKLIWGSSSAHCAVHFAYILGCSPIVLLGMDCCKEDDKQRFNDFEGQPDDGMQKKEFERYGINDEPILDIFSITWSHIAKANPGINIINASGGKLEAFPRMELAEAIEQHA